jgi:hypothetical protein
VARVTEQPAKMVWVNALCDKCDGIMTSANEARVSHPPTFKHVCQDCGAVEWLRETFPHTRVRRQNPAPRLAGMC